eukprot:g11865.t1
MFATKIPEDEELLAAVAREGGLADRLHRDITEYKDALQQRILSLDGEIKFSVRDLVHETAADISRVERERVEILKQLTDLQEIRIRLEDAIQRKTKLRQRTETELKKTRRVALLQKRNQDVKAEVLRELKAELGKISHSLHVLATDDKNIQYDIEQLFRAKETIDYVLDTRKTQIAIDKELLHARHNFKLPTTSTSS